MGVGGVEFIAENRGGAGVRLRKGKVEMGGNPAAEAEAAERADGDPARDRDWSCVALGDNVGQAVFVNCSPGGLASAMSAVFQAWGTYMSERRELYHSPNGDSWFLGREPENGRAFIIHQPKRTFWGSSITH